MQTYLLYQGATARATTPADAGTITQIAAVLNSGGPGFAMGFDPAMANNIVKMIPGSSNDLPIVIPVSIPFRKGQIFYVTGDSVILTTV